MKFVKFPDAIRAESAARAKTVQEQVKSRISVGQSYESPGLAFKMPSGAVRPVYDPYNPEYPEGATPGRAMIRETRRYYMNESEGYESQAWGFVPLSAEELAD